MKQQQPFSLAKRLKSFTYAFNGLKILIREEPNAKIHVCAGICAVILGFILGLTVVEWIAICFVIGLIFILELINTAIENIADAITLQKDDRIKKIKDLAAASVLIGSIIAIITGIVIFLPKLIALCCT